MPCYYTALFQFFATDLKFGQRYIKGMSRIDVDEIKKAIRKALQYFCRITFADHYRTRCNFACKSVFNALPAGTVALIFKPEVDQKQGRRLQSIDYLLAKITKGDAHFSSYSILRQHFQKARSRRQYRAVAGVSVV